MRLRPWAAKSSLQQSKRATARLDFARGGLAERRASAPASLSTSRDSTMCLCLCHPSQNLLRSAACSPAPPATQAPHRPVAAQAFSAHHRQPKKLMSTSPAYRMLTQWVMGDPRRRPGSMLDVPAEGSGREFRSREFRERALVPLRLWWLLLLVVVGSSSLCRLPAHGVGLCHVPRAGDSRGSAR